MVSFKEFLSVYDELREDVAALQQQSQQYQQQIQDLTVKTNRLVQMKAAVDKQIAQQSQQQQTQNQQAQATGAQAAAAATPSAAPAAGGTMAAPTVQ